MTMTKAGGRREGSGRKPQEIKRATFTIRVAPDTQSKLKELRKAGIKIGEQFDRYIDLLYNELLQK